MGEAAINIEAYLEEERQKGAIVFLPSAIIPDSFYRPVVETVWLTDDDIYKSQGKFRIKYEGLCKLSGKAGIEWSPMDSGRTDDGRDKLYISFRAVGLIRKADGKLYPTACNYELDLELEKEDLEEQYRKKAEEKSWKDDRAKIIWINDKVKRDWFHKRRHKHSLSESGARARVIRSILGLPSQYQKKNEILDRPFVIVRFVLDHQNPDIKQALLTAARENMSAVFGHGSIPALPKFVSAASGDDNVIDLPHQPASPEPPAEEQGNPYGDPPGQEPDSRLIDFENSDPESQVQTLTYLFKARSQNLGDYLNRAKIKSLDQLPAKTRIELFIYLNNQGEKR
ncbi:hypothetical protein [Desulfospira joergensenii]|uniref:hypothetical protein n=1 Tax=Desulfospira joergensenii TaxID=53329 RepID=UPI0003B6C49D|nr:hypothetical protein [Desulfospira joergensenii]